MKPRIPRRDEVLAWHAIPKESAAAPRESRREFLAGIGVAALGTTSAAAERILDPWAAIAAVLARQEPAVWVFTGDCITDGDPHSLAWRSFPEHFAECVRWQMGRMRDVVVNTAISGDSIDQLLADLDWRVLQFKPTVVSILVDTNDCDRGTSYRENFRKNLVALIDKVRAAGALPLLNRPGNLFAGHADLPAYTEITGQVADEKNAALVDHHAYWQDARPTQQMHINWIEDNSVHAKVDGHRALAHLLFQELGIFDPESSSCMLATP